MAIIGFIQLVEAAEAKGLKFDAFTSVFDRWGDHVTPETIVQINTEKHVWCTWSFDGKLDSDFAMFRGRYNQANGATQKTYSKERKALEILGL